MLSKESFEFNLHTKTKFGIGIANNLGSYLKDLGYHRPGLIIDEALMRLKKIEKIIESVKSNGFDFFKVYNFNLKAEPDYDSLDIARKYFVENGKSIVDCFVGIGGGSVIDFAKGLSTIAVNPGPAISYRGFPKGINPSLPTIAIPTTAGTASEITFNAVFIDKKEEKKLGINTHSNFPALAILDPEMTESCPKSVAVSSGMDALVHALESFAASQHNSLTRIFARESFSHVFNNLPEAINNPQNIEARAHVLFGSYLAGISLCNSGSGPAGALSYPLGVRFKVPHGIGGGMFIAHVVEHNVKNGYLEYDDLYDSIGEINKNLSPEKKALAFSQQLFGLYEKIQVPQDITRFGLTKDKLDSFMVEVEKLQGAFNQNPIAFSKDDARRILTTLIGD
jgi:alcohol dehydrogenase class IV